jgi:hypothetical protein
MTSVPDAAPQSTEPVAAEPPLQEHRALHPLAGEPEECSCGATFETRDELLDHIMRVIPAGLAATDGCVPSVGSDKRHERGGDEVPAVAGVSA